MKRPLQHDWLTAAVFFIVFFNGPTLGWTQSEDMGGAMPDSYRPIRTCAPPAIEQFPLPLMRPLARIYGGLILHILVAVFTFIALLIVCKDYFVSSLYRICEELNLTPDVVGASFMAAGNAAPMLTIDIFNLFFAQDDLGVNGVVGSTACNMLFIISVWGLSGSTVPRLNCWPLFRDWLFYAISIFVMLYVIVNGYVSWFEALVMLITYGVYCVVLLNCTAKRWACCKNYKSTDRAAPAQPGGDQTQMEGQTRESELQNPPAFNPECGDSATYEESAAQVLPADEAPAHCENKDHRKEADTAVNPFVRPNGANCCQLAWWYVAYVVHRSCRLTIPDCRGRWYLVSVLVSVLWISFYAYFMVWMITIIGHTLGIPDALMGLTFVAIGTSVSSAITSLAVIKKGYGDMVVSNAVGSSVFNILVCLGLPWFVQTAIIRPGSYVIVYSNGIMYTAFSLFLTVIFLVVATLANGRKLDRRCGVTLMICYLLFIAVASLYELNIFGSFHPPVCDSMY